MNSKLQGGMEYKMGFTLCLELVYLSHFIPHSYDHSAHDLKSTKHSYPVEQNVPEESLQL